MSKLDVSVILPRDSGQSMKKLVALIREVNNQVNALSEDRASARHGAMTAAPTTGAWVQGDEVKNSAPTELGAAASKYVIIGWVCVAGGISGTWVQQRVLTGN